MKKLKTIIGIILIGNSLTALADTATNAPVKPYPLKTRLVCGMALGMMGKPCEFTCQGRQIKVCDKSEQELFAKSPEKYLKKLAAAEAKARK